jgi:phosphoribosylamine--glycine ligase/phosphoribosylformylglycinamidine cyclo-ligase
MKRHGIPTAEFSSFSDFTKAEKYIRGIKHRVVVKASGLAAGKGVIIPRDTDEAVAGER